MEGQNRVFIRQKIADSLATTCPILTERNIHLPKVKNKALAVIGMRRSGKTSFLWQILQQRLNQGLPRKALLYFNFEDERLAEMKAQDLHWVIEEYYQFFPEWRDTKRVSFFLDEIQVVPGWETFIRRILDTENSEIFLSGSSARLLSKEVATSMRGRALEVVVHPFSFREVLRHKQMEPNEPSSALPKAKRSLLRKHFQSYISEGGFPEIQGLQPRDRFELLKNYIDVVILRDVIERYQVTNPVALRWLQRHLLGNAATAFSIQKFYDALRSQGIPVSKDTLHDYLGHLEDAFLLRTISIHSKSERQRMVNPRKIYPIDPAFIPLYARMDQDNLGHALETIVFLELERRGYEINYVKTQEGYEVDFYAAYPLRAPLLIQVCADVSHPATFEREIRALNSARKEHLHAHPLLLTLDALPAETKLPSDIDWMTVVDWLLEAY